MQTYAPLPTVVPSAYEVFSEMAGPSLCQEFDSTKIAFSAYQEAIRQRSPLPAAFNAVEAIDWAREQSWFTVDSDGRVTVDLRAVTI